MKVKTSKYKAVLFDFYNTLVYVDPEVRGKIVDILAKRVGVKKNEWSNVANTLTPKYFTGQIKTSREYYISILKELGKYPTEDLLSELEKLEYANRYEAITTYPETHKVLTELKNLNIKLSLISNCSCTIFNILEFLDLRKYFDVLSLSCEVGILKPEPEIYLYAVRKLNLEPQDCLFVGDGDHQELDGAKNVGITACKINQKIGYMKKDGESTQYDFEISSLNELLEIFKNSPTL